ncbi:MAG: transposase [Candidatus Tectomicrobia bacterium]|nr:transposase [Candidatus Tectomicrobia bacterium]
MPGKNAEDIAALVDVERQVLQACIGAAPWERRSLIQVWVGQVADRLGEPDGIIAFDPSRFPKRGTHSVGVQRQGCGHRGKVDTCQVGVFMGYVCDHDHAWLDFRLYLPEDWARDVRRRQAGHGPPEVRYQTRQDQGLEILDAWGEQVPYGWVAGDDELGRHPRFRHADGWMRDGVQGAIFWGTGGGLPGLPAAASADGSRKALLAAWHHNHGGISSTFNPG